MVSLSCSGALAQVKSGVGNCREQVNCLVVHPRVSRNPWSMNARWEACGEQEVDAVRECVLDGDHLTSFETEYIYGIKFHTMCDSASGRRSSDVARETCTTKVPVGWHRMLWLDACVEGKDLW